MNKWFQVFYVNWLGEWTSDKRYRTHVAANRRLQTVRRTKAENGRATIQLIYEVTK